DVPTRGELRAVAHAAAPSHVVLRLVEAEPVPLVDPGRALGVDAHVRARDFVGDSQPELARSLGEAVVRRVRRVSPLGGHSAATREHVGCDSGGERVTELNVSVVEETVELDAAEAAGEPGGPVAAFASSPGEVAAHGHVPVDLVAHASPQVETGLELHEVGGVEMRERGVTATLNPEQDAAVPLILLCLRRGGPGGGRQDDGPERCEPAN